MRKLLGLGIAAILAIGLFSTPSVAQQSCQVWQQDCARYYGWNNGNWQNCMSQPGALAACGRGGYYGGGGGYQGGGYAYRRPGQSCAVWKQDCARYYGWGNGNWQNCMTQPGAVAACGGYGGY